MAYNAVQTSLSISNMQAFINSIDKTGKSVKNACITGMNEGAKIIQTEQKRLILARPNRDGTHSGTLANLIKVNKKISSNRHGTYRMFIGYSKEALKEHPEALVIEFGRPSLYRKNVRFTIKQKRNGKEVVVTNGYVPEYSHIRRAYDNKIAEAAQAVVDRVDRELKVFGYGNADTGDNLNIQGNSQYNQET